LKIVFMGTPDFAVESLDTLVHSSHEIVAVVTVQDKAQGRGLKIKESPVKIFAKKNDIPLIQPDKLNDEDFVNNLVGFNADCFVVVAFRILPQVIFSIPKFGTINVHASLLPKYRGAAPINWAIMNGERETGVTTMLIDKKVDTGNILFQEKVNIPETMTAGELHDLLAEKGANLLLRTLEKIEKGDIQPMEQDHLTATKAPKIRPEAALISFNTSALNVHNKIRGLSPYPGAYTFFKGKKIKILKSIVSTSKTIDNPGVVRRVGTDFFEVDCSDGCVLVYEVQLEGKNRMSVKDFLNGYPVAQGTRLG
jgi:methionyl-tRNA formyltransferase